jgi:hypothetical protein
MASIGQHLRTLTNALATRRVSERTRVFQEKQRASLKKRDQPDRVFYELPDGSSTRMKPRARMLVKVLTLNATDLGRR